MPRTVQDILNHGDELAKRFEGYQPTAGGSLVGTSGEAARQRYGARQEA